MTKKLIIFLLLVTSLHFHANAEDIKIGKKSSIHSKILQEKREYWVSLPKSYRENGYKKYPVLYLLDTEVHSFFKHFLVW